MARLWFKSIILCSGLMLQTRSESLVEGSNVTWISPTEGSIFQPGDTIIGKWHSNLPLVSPAFSLCEVSSDSIEDYSSEDEDEDGVDGVGNCGSAVWPHIQEQPDGYITVIFVSNVSEDKHLNLKMQDSNGNVFISPSFYLKTLQSVTTHASHIATTSQEFVSSGIISNEVALATSSTTPMRQSITTLAAPENSLIGSDQSHHTKTPHVIVPTTALLPDILVSRRPAQIAAFAVPITVVSAIALIATLLSIRAKRKLVRERKNEFKSLLLSRRGSHSNFKTDVSETLSQRYPGGYYNPDTFPVHAPAFMPRYEVKEVIRNPLYPQSRQQFPKSHSTEAYYERSSYTKPNPVDGQFTMARRTMNDTFNAPPAMYATPLSKLPPLHVRTKSSMTLYTPPRHPPVDVYAVIEERLRDGK